MKEFRAKDELSFLDGYLYRVMVDVLRSQGKDDSGLYSYYEARIEQERSALSGYDRMLLAYIAKHFDPPQRQIVHAGVGLGTLASALAANGYKVAAIEAEARRFRAATDLRAALLQAWRPAADNYTLVYGEFPAVLSGTPWISPRSVLIFTNCGATWSEELTESIISTMPLFGDTLLDARLFGVVRETPAERQELIDRIEAKGLRATPLPDIAKINVFYYHLRPRESGS